MRCWATIFLLLPALAAATDLAYVDALDTRSAVIVDSRPLADCKQASLPGARCLPAGEFLGPHRRLPSERDILWLLGTAGLGGSETVMVVGQDATARDFLAGLLYLAGQHRVRVLKEPVTRLIAQRKDGAPGQERGMIRTAVFTAPMRAELWLLKDELARELKSSSPPLIDGRSELEYWGEAVRAARGGHLPGATRLAAAASPLPLHAKTIVYGHDALDGIAFFTRLMVGQEIALRVYPGGWAEWAADGSLPVDAATYPERQLVAQTAVSPTPTIEDAGTTGTAGTARLQTVFAAFVALLAAFAGGWVLSTRRRA